jgi:hypothetical protein
MSIAAADALACSLMWWQDVLHVGQEAACLDSKSKVLFQHAGQAAASQPENRSWLQAKV